MASTIKSILVHFFVIFSFTGLLGISAFANEINEKHFNIQISERPLSAALIDFGMQSGVSIAFEDEALKGLMAPAINGNYTLSEALDLLTKGNPISYEYVDATTIRIFKKKDNIIKNEIKSRIHEPPSHLEHVYVNAQRKREGAQSVPISLSAYSVETLDKNNIDTLGDLIDIDSSLMIVGASNPRNYGIKIRGVGSSGINAGVDPTVGVYLDGVWLPRPGMILGDLVDIESVEILKGPQGALFGRNTSAGVISINTAKPTDFFSSRLDLGFGNYNERIIRGYISGAATEILNARASFWTRDHSGYMKNKTEAEDPNDYETYGARLVLAQALGNNFDLTLSADYQYIEQNCCDGVYIDISDEALERYAIMSEALNVPLSEFPTRSENGYLITGAALEHSTSSRDFQFQKDKQKGISSEITYTFTDALAGHRIETTLAYRDWDSVGYTANSDLPVLFASFPINEFQNVSSAEIRFFSPEGNRVEYLTGLYYLEQDVYFTQQVEFFGACEYSLIVQTLSENEGLDPSQCKGLWRNDDWRQRATSFAGFGSLNYKFSNVFSANIGLRFSKDYKRAKKRALIEHSDNNQEFGINRLGSVGYNENISAGSTTWSASLSYDASSLLNTANQLMLYTRYATGYKAPGLNARPVRQESIPKSFREETSDHFEMGFKSEWLDRQLRINLSVFQTEYSELQQVAANPPDSEYSGLGTFVQNSGDLRHKGYDISYALAVGNWWQLKGSYLSLDSEYANFRFAPCPVVGEIPRESNAPNRCNFNEYPADFAPKTSTSHQLHFDAPIKSSGIQLFSSLGVSYLSDLYLATNLDDRSLRNDLILYNANIGLKKPNTWSIEFWVKNLTDEKYYISSSNCSQSALFGCRGSYNGRLGAPNTFGFIYKAWL